jgi:hypothetical protein
VVSPRRSHPLAIAVLVCSGIAAYLNSFRGTFQFDDFANIRDDPRLVSFGSYIQSIGQMIRPLTRLTFLIDRHLYGDDPTGYHVLNLVLHVGCGILVYGIVRESMNRLKRTRLPDPIGALASLPFWTALLFLVHPIATETVTYLSGRATGLMAFFYLASFYLFTRFAVLRQQSSPFVMSYLGAIACFVLALLSKEVALTLPAALLLWEYVFIRETEESPGHLPRRFHLPFWGIGALFLIAAAFTSRYQYLLSMGLGLRPLWVNLVTQIRTVGYAAGLFFSPARLTFDHDLSVYHSILQWPVPFCLLILVGLLFASICYVPKMPFFSFGLLWFFLALVPTNSVIPRYDLLSERNLYLPSIGFYMAGASLWISFARKLASACRERGFLDFWAVNLTRKLSGALPVLLTLVFLSYTVTRNGIYANQVTFWLDAVRKAPRKARPHNNLGYAYSLAGDVDHAIEQFRIASQLDPAFISADENLLKARNVKKSQTTAK